jgi:hypothetical protein
MSDRERMADIEVVAEKRQRRAASMTLDSYLKRWLLTPPISGKQARAISLVMIAVPTLTRAALDGIVVGIGFSPYYPF